MHDLEAIAAAVIDSAFDIHRELGPGMMEKPCEKILAGELRLKGLYVERQKRIDLVFRGVRHREALRLDLLVERRLVVEIKSVPRIYPVHLKQTLTYLKALNLPLGLLINFGGARLADGLRRVVNGYEGPGQAGPAVTEAPPARLDRR